jgi:hypothetical protein
MQSYILHMKAFDVLLVEIFVIQDIFTYVLIIAQQLMFLLIIQIESKERAFKTTDVGKTLTRNGQTIKTVWIPGHCGIEGNEEADQLAKSGTEHNQAPCSQAYTSYAWMNRMAKDKSITKWRAVVNVPNIS